MSRLSGNVESQYQSSPFSWHIRTKCSSPNFTDMLWDSVMCGDFHISATEMVEVRKYQNNVSNTLT